MSQNTVNKIRDIKDIQCRYCKEFGHFIKNCPTRPPDRHNDLGRERGRGGGERGRGGRERGRGGGERGRGGGRGGGGGRRDGNRDKPQEILKPVQKPLPSEMLWPSIGDIDEPKKLSGSDVLIEEAVLKGSWAGGSIVDIIKTGPEESPDHSDDQKTSDWVVLGHSVANIKIE